MRTYGRKSPAPALHIYLTNSRLTRLGDFINKAPLARRQSFANKSSPARRIPTKATKQHWHRRSPRHPKVPGEPRLGNVRLNLGDPRAQVTSFG